VPTIFYIKKHLHLALFIKKNFPNSQIYFIRHPRRSDLDILHQLPYQKTVLFSEIKRDEMKNAIFYSGPSALALQLHHDGFNVNFINLFPGHLESYYLERSNFSYVSIV
jgi:hypothetical protein